jgi:hypothetical protein
MRRRLSYANVVATLALVFAMSGGALAANHYLINSTKQINPKVLKKLKGITGKAGAPGANGPIGLAGAPGPGGKEGLAGKEGLVGKEGKEGKPGEPGQSATKLWAVVSSTGELARGSGVVSSEKGGTGLYFVKFDKDITACSWIGTVGTTGFSGIEFGDINIAGKFETTDTLFVTTFSNGGTSEDKSFHLAVLC